MAIALAGCISIAMSGKAEALNKVHPIDAAKKKLQNSLKKTEPVSKVREKWALVVSLDSFHDKAIKPIKFGLNNAILISALLANPEMGRFGPKHVLTVTNTKAIQKNIQPFIKGNI